MAFKEIWFDRRTNAVSSLPLPQIPGTEHFISFEDYQKLEKENERLARIIEGHHPNCNYLSLNVCDKCGFIGTKALKSEADK